MPRRIALFILGLVIALGAFWLYQLMFGQNIGPGVKPRAIASPLPDNSSLQITERDANGVLIYAINAAHSPEQLKDANGHPLPGQFRLDHLVATWYDKSGRTLEIRGDSCDIQIAPGAGTGGVHGAGPKANSGNGQSTKISGIGADGKNVDLSKLHLEDFSAAIKDHVYLTISPPPQQRAAGPAGSGRESLASGMRIYFDGPLHLDGSQSLLSTTDGIHIRSDLVDLNGKGMQLVMNPDSNPRRIERLRLEDNPDGNEIIFRNVGTRALALSTAPTTVSAGTQSADASHGTGEPAKAPPAIAAAATKAGESPPVTYRTSFGEKVLAKVGSSSLSADRLYLMFMASRELGTAQNEPAPPAIPPPPGAGPATAAATAQAPEFPDEPAPIAPVRPEDLSVTWSGPMELRPMEPADARELALQDPQDIALEAVGTAADPVIVTQNSTRIASIAGATLPAVPATAPASESSILVKAGHLMYPGRARPITLSPGDFKQVLLTQTERRNTPAGPSKTDEQISCGEVTFDRNQDTAVLAGPGKLIRTAGDQQFTANWDTRMDVALENAPGSNRDSGGKVIKSAKLLGAAVASSAFDLKSQVLDVLMDNRLGLDGKALSSLGNLQATGDVEVHSYNARRGRGTPDGILADQLEIQTAVPADGVGGPIPTRMIADGHVTAWRYSAGENDFGLGGPTDVPASGRAAAVAANDPPAGSTDLTKGTLIAPHLVADLIPRPPAAASTRAAAGAAERPGTSPPASPDDFSGVAQNVTFSHALATGGIRVTVEPPAGSGRPPIDVLADALDENALTGLAVLSSAKTPEAAPVKASMGQDFISASVLNITQETGGDALLDVPVPGSFQFQTHDASGNIQTLVADWQKSMRYDNTQKRAVITGHPVMRVVGEKEELANLRCDDTLTAQLKAVEGTAKAGRAAARGGGAQPANRAGPAGDAALELDWLEAVGNVQAGGLQADADGKPQVEIKVSALDDPGEASSAAGGRAAVQGRLKYTSADQSFEIPGPGALVINDHRPTSQGNGESAFGWQGDMHFDGVGETVSFSKGVVFVFKPTGGFKFNSGLAGAAMPAGAVAAGGTDASAKAPGGKNQANEAILKTQQLTAKLVAAKKQPGAKTTSSPIQLTAASVSSVAATGGVDLTVGDFDMTGDRLNYDVPTLTAIVWGNGEDPAVAERLGYEVEADSYTLDMTKDQNSLTAVRPRGDLVGLGLP